MNMWDLMKKRMKVQKEKDLGDFARDVNGGGTNHDLSTASI